MSSSSATPDALQSAVEPRAGDGDFTVLPIPPRLRIPCPGIVPEASLELPASDRFFTAGETLMVGRRGSAPTPLTPAPGKVIGESKAFLTDGHPTRAIDFEVISTPQESAAAPKELSVELPSPNQVVQAVREVDPGDLSMWIERLRNAGVWADRWSSPDLLGQMNQCLRRPVDTIICNTLDATAAMPLQVALAGTYPHELVAGAALLGKLTGARFVWLVLDEADAAELAPLLKAVCVTVGISIVTVRNVYPQPQPTLLLHTLTRRKLPPGELPTAHGAMILDAAALISIGRVVLRGEPALSAPIALFDSTQGRTYLRWIAIGTSVREALIMLEVIPKSARLPRLYAGVPMRRITVPQDAVISAGSELTLLVSADPVLSVRPDPCVRCGWCVEGCPVRIHPAALLDAAQLNDRPMADRYGIDACIECGICSYVCPSQLPLLEGIRYLRESMMPS